MNQTRALTVSETCAWLGLSKPTALKLLKNGKIPGAKLGKSWRISQQVIESLLRGGGNGGSEQSGKPALPEAA